MAVVARLSAAVDDGDSFFVNGSIQFCMKMEHGAFHTGVELV